MNLIDYLIFLHFFQQHNQQFVFVFVPQVEGNKVKDKMGKKI